MRRHITLDTSAKHKRGMAVKNNATTSPFVIAGLLAAITVVVFAIIFLWYRVTL